MRLRSNRTRQEFERGNLNATTEERRALDELFTVTYAELRRLANSVRRGDPSATLSPTALVNEAWLKLMKSPHFATESQLHFKRIAARAMRQVLIEGARRRSAQKRDSGAEVTFSVDDLKQEAGFCGEDLLALDSALEELARIEPRQATIVETRFFGGMEVAETAALLGVSEATIQRDWRAARAWLSHRVRRAH
jgi:RNA polymerase sigma factor (TIGR02999 family)